MQEMHFFVGSFFGGAILIVSYDILRFIRKLLPHSRVAVNIEDFLFWIGASIFIFKIIYQLNAGELRGFGILCMIGGMALYHFGVSDMLVELLYKVVGTLVLKIVKILKRGLKKAVRPFKMGIQKLRYVCRKHGNEEKHESGQAYKKKYQKK